MDLQPRAETVESAEPEPVVLLAVLAAQDQTVLQVTSLDLLGTTVAVAVAVHLEMEFPTLEVVQVETAEVELVRLPEVFLLMAYFNISVR